MNTCIELQNYGFDESTALMMIRNYSERIGETYGVWKVIDIYYDDENKKQFWKMKCNKCGREKIVKRPKKRDISTTCECMRKKKEKKKVVLNSDISHIGETYGDFTVTNITTSEKGTKWICRCKECGNEIQVTPGDMKNGSRSKCIRCHPSRITNHYDNSYIGKHIWNYTIIGFDKKHEFICKCDCGKIKRVTPINLITGNVKSCGCMAKEYTRLLVTVHGDSSKEAKYHRLYEIFRGMIDRCYNSNSPRYKYYGERGITICDEWKNSYIEFKKWAISSGYDLKKTKKEQSIDRINVNGNYEPSNCRWADAKTQANNRRPRSEWVYKKKTHNPTHN